MTRLVLVGAGHAHVEVLRRFAMAPVPGAHITLLTKLATTPYSGMLHAVVAQEVPTDAALIDCAALAQQAGATFVLGEMTGLDLAGKAVLRRDGPPVPFDVLSLDIGSTPNTGSVPGASDHALPVKPIDGFLDRFDELAMRMAFGTSHVAVVGAGAAGVELAIAVQRRLGPLATLTLVSGTPDILPEFPAGVRRRVLPILARQGIAVVAGSPVVVVEPNGITLADGRGIEAEHVLWTTQAAAPAFLRDTGLVLDDKGFVRVDGYLRAVGHPNVFAVGDVAAFDPRPLPKSGVYAVRQGPVLAQSLRSVLTGGEPVAFEPQRNALYLLSTGPDHAVGTKGPFAFQGRWVKRWKTWLDTSFMQRYPRP